MKIPNCPICGLNSMLEVEDCGNGFKIVACMYCDLPQDDYVYENHCWNCGNAIDSRTSIPSVIPDMGYQCTCCGKDLSEWKKIKQIGVLIMSEQNVIERQLEFVEWLKSKNLYNEMVSGVTMDRMHQVWEACQEPVKTFTLYWRTGESNLVEGKTVAKAMNNFGYGAGAVSALDFWNEGDNKHKYKWDSKKRNWDRIIKENLDE